MGKHVGRIKNSKKRQEKKLKQLLRKAYFVCLLLPCAALFAFAYYKVDVDDIGALEAQQHSDPALPKKTPPPILRGEALRQHQEKTESRMPINKVAPPKSRGAVPAPVPLFQRISSSPLARIAALEKKVLFKEESGHVFRRVKHLEKIVFQDGRLKFSVRNEHTFIGRIERLEKFLSKKQWGKPYKHIKAPVDERGRAIRFAANHIAG
jgi:hypothetical protein